MNPDKLVDTDYKIGLEIHIQSSSKTKIFSNEAYSFNLKSNTQVSPVSLGLPGTLPYLNNDVVDKAILLAIAANCSISKKCFFNRKNYFYPDLPKGYQITQYSSPIGTDGYISFREKESNIKKIGIQSIHIEEDSGKSLHQSKETLLDFNRSGVPLIEIVTKPDFNSIEDVGSFIKDLILLVKHLKVSECKMEEGNIRVDVNVSIKNKETKKEIISEIKNLNSIRNIKKALVCEISNLNKILASDKNYEKRTCGYNDVTGKVYELREKPSSLDYRFIVEPDIPPYEIKKEKIETIKEQIIGQLPLTKFLEYHQKFNIPVSQADFIISNPTLTNLFEEMISSGHESQLILKILTGPIQKCLTESTESEHNFKKSINKLLKILELISQGKLLKSDVYNVIIPAIGNNTDCDINKFVKNKSSNQSDQKEELLEIIDNIVKSNFELVEKIKNGKTGLINHFVGLIMKQVPKGTNPAKIKIMLNNLLRDI